MGRASAVRCTLASCHVFVVAEIDVESYHVVVHSLGTLHPIVATTGPSMVAHVKQQSLAYT